MSLTRSLVTAAALAALLALAGCGGDGSSSGTTATATTAGEDTITPEGTTTSEQTTTAEESTTSTTEAGSGAAAVPKVKTVKVTVVGARPEGGIVRASVKKGDKVALVVTSDVADEIHLHGYDLMKDVGAGGTARITFVATIPGRFEAELESRGVQIADLTVSP